MRSKYSVGLLAATLLSTAAWAQTPVPAPKAAAPVTTTTAPIAHTGMWRASKLIGVNVYNEENQKLGDINEVLLDQSGKVLGVVVGVGGFLGMGEHDIMVDFNKIKFVNEPVRTSAATTPPIANDPARVPTNTRNVSNEPARPVRAATEKWYPDHAVINATKDQLKAMTQFKYTN